MGHRFERSQFLEAATTNVAGPFCLSGFSIVDGEPGSVAIYHGDTATKSNLIDNQNSAVTTVVTYTEGVRVDNATNMHVVLDACNVVLRKT